jgi:histidinol dehydrogenase
MQLVIEPSTAEFEQLAKRPELEMQDLEKKVLEIFQLVKSNSDEALKDFAKKFDKAELTDLLVTQVEIQEAEQLISDELKKAIEVAHRNITLFHATQKTEIQKIETMPGVVCWRKSVGIEKVGIYIPGGTAPLFSTVLMLAIPATLAGCKEITLCSPPNQQGKIHPAILYAAQRCGVSRIIKTGGAQAIAALTFGTETVSKVHKIFGPGNQYVTMAKTLATRYGVAIDMPAGPSEVLVYADETCKPEFVAADLLSQAEHGNDSQVILITSTQELATSIMNETEAQLNQLKRFQFASNSLVNSKAIVLQDRKNVLHFINAYAPEHLILACKQANELAEELINAGSVFIGNYTPESAGDYASGTNHTLPTNGYAKNYSGVSLDSFVKKITFQEINKEGLKNIGPSIECMAEAEELTAHKNAVSIRLKSLTT